MSNQKFDVSHLTQHWLHSHEEDTPTSTVYRPAKFSFPPSRGRKGFDLKPDGTLIAKKPGATDQTETRAGTWKLVDNKLQLSVGGDAPAQTLSIESVEPNRLVVVKPSDSSTTA